jgi:hypothetical protein
MAMKIVRRIMIALLAVAMLASGAARAASTTNFSDQWWIETESGWGASVLQQADIIFVDLFVYGADNAPTWFTAAASYQNTGPAGHVVFTGDLYRTNGPYYGAPFGSAPVTYAKVGTLTFDANTINTATLTYTVGGVAYVKNVTRQTWRFENIGGSYYGGLVYDQTSCSDAIDNGHYEIFGNLTFTHTSTNAVTLGMQITSAFFNGAPLPLPAGVSYTMTGTYTQAGHMGAVSGKSAITVPGEATDTATVYLIEVERTITGLSGRYTAIDDLGGCKASGRFAGIRR